MLLYCKYCICRSFRHTVLCSVYPLSLIFTLPTFPFFLSPLLRTFSSSSYPTFLFFSLSTLSSFPHLRLLSIPEQIEVCRLLLLKLRSKINLLLSLGLGRRRKKKRQKERKGRRKANKRWKRREEIKRGVGYGEEGDSQCIYLNFS